jgi:hypothetical protein
MATVGMFGPARICNEQPAFGQIEGKAIGHFAVAGRNGDFAGRGIDPVDIAGRLLPRRNDAFPIVANAVARVGEPDGAVRFYHDIVRRIEASSLIPIGDDRERAVGFGANDAAAAVLAGDEPALPVARAAVCVSARAPEYRCTLALDVAEHAVVGDVAPDQNIQIGKVGRTFAEARAGIQSLQFRTAEDATAKHRIGNVERQIEGIWRVIDLHAHHSFRRSKPKITISAAVVNHGKEAKSPV